MTDHTAGQCHERLKQVRPPLVMEGQGRQQRFELGPEFVRDAKDVHATIVTPRQQL